MRHKWTETEVPQKLKDSFARRFICGYCGCEKLISKSDSRVKIYERSQQISQTMPECFGKIPLNEQTID